MIKVLYEDNHLLCVEKPVNVPVQADRSHDPDLLGMCKAYLKEKYHKPGNVWLGLVHRLDRPVGGAMVFARTDKAASRLSDAVRRGQLQKTYYAVLDGQMREAEGTLTDWLVKDSRTNTTAVTDEAHGKKSVLHYRILGIRDGMSLAEILLETGRSHQIRVQFASRGCPLVCDQRYHPAPEKGQIALWAARLSFPHPVTKEIITVESHTPDTYPWNRFEVID